MSVEENTGSVGSPGIEYPETETLPDSARETDAKPVRFDAVLQPHTTLGPRGMDKLIHDNGEVRRILHCFMRKLWWLEMVNFIEVLEDIGCFGFWVVCMLVHVNLERIWH